MSKNNNLTYMQQIALEGEVAYAVSTAFHNADLKLRIYLILKELKKDFRNYVIKAIKEITTFPEGELERVLWEINQNELPLWLWIEKCIADIKMSMYRGELTYSPECNLAINKRQAKLNLVRSAFSKFIREVSMCSSKAARELVTKVMEDNELDFLHPSCVFYLEEIKVLEEFRPPKTRIPRTIMEKVFNIKSILSFVIETEALEQADKFSEETTNKSNKTMNNSEKEENGQKFLNTLEAAISSLIEDLPNKENKTENKKTKYIVVKKFTGSNFQVPLRDFNTRSEALTFLDEIAKNFPELKKTCTFDIIRKEGI